MVTLSTEAGQGSEPGTLLKRHPLGVPSAPLAVPHAREGSAAPPGDREGCKALQETPERMKRCTDT